MKLLYELFLKIMAVDSQCLFLTAQSHCYITDTPSLPCQIICQQWAMSAFGLLPQNCLSCVLTIINSYSGSCQNRTGNVRKAFANYQSH